MAVWPVYRASGFKEIFQFYEPHYLAWLPNEETFFAHGHSYDDVNVVDISWFYDKTIGKSIADVKTGENYPAEQTPNYKYYTGEISFFERVICPSCGSVLDVLVELPPFELPPWVELTKSEQYCKVCGADLGIRGYGHVIYEKMTKQSITCPGCGKILELTVSSIPENNSEQYCPFCGASCC